jgi:cyclophilin family peptidyl-prolyl cis-trans isomerase
LGSRPVLVSPEQIAANLYKADEDPPRQQKQHKALGEENHPIVFDESKTLEEASVGQREGSAQEIQNDRGPKRFRMELANLKDEGTGTVVLETRPSWAPIGAEHFEELVSKLFYDECRFFRVLPNFIVQFGISGSPEVQSQWRKTVLKDDPVLHSNARGTITYAMSGKDTRTTQLFINKKDNEYLDKEGFAPFGLVLEGMEYIDQINDEYKEKPGQGKIQNQGNEYLEKEFPNLSYIASIREILLENGGELYEEIEQDAA